MVSAVCVVSLRHEFSMFPFYVTEVCGGRLYAPAGTIKSPGFPNSYHPSKNCIWIITAPTGKQVELVVKSFELEENSACDFDFLEIRCVVAIEFNYGISTKL